MSANKCPLCLRPRATQEQEDAFQAGKLEDDEALCWRDFFDDCDGSASPHVADIDPTDTARIVALARDHGEIEEVRAALTAAIPAMIDEHRRAILAEQQKPSGGEDLGFHPEPEGWVKRSGGCAIVVSPAPMESDLPWWREVYRAGVRVGKRRAFETARGAMKAR